MDILITLQFGRAFIVAKYSFPLIRGSLCLLCPFITGTALLSIRLLEQLSLHFNSASGLRDRVLFLIEVLASRLAAVEMGSADGLSFWECCADFVGSAQEVFCLEVRRCVERVGEVVAVPGTLVVVVF